MSREHTEQADAFAQHQSGPAVLEGSSNVGERAARPAPREPVREALLRSGELIAQRFRVERLARIGGMGAVYRAYDLETAQPVAIKVTTNAQHGSLARFEREAAVLAELSHPAIVRYVAHGLVSLHSPFLAMEWLEGEDLASRLRRQGINVEESLGLARRVCEALQAAHAHGIVHRDIKPSNIFLVGGQPGAAKLVDFGIARSDRQLATLTRRGALLGTVGYMAPEQAMGASDVDPRADIFALGCVLFECLVGHAAFAGPHEIAVLARVLRVDPPPLSQLRPELDTKLDALLGRLLAKEREQRPASARALLGAFDELERIVGSAPLSAPRQHREPRIGAEQVFESVVLGQRQGGARTSTEAEARVAAEQLEKLAQRFGAEAVPIQNGALLLLLRAQAGLQASDRAVQAARCALTIKRSCPQLSLSVATGSVDSSSSLPVGAAIDRAAALLSGDPVNRAVLLDELTARLLGTRFELRRSQEGVALVRELAGPDDDAQHSDERTPFTAREKELALLDATLEECRGDQVARVLLVTAPPGIGKSRLGREFVDRVRARDLARVLYAKSDPLSAGSPLALARQLLRFAAGLRESSSQDARAQRLRAYIESLLSGEAAGHAVTFLGELLGLREDHPDALLRAARADTEIMSTQTRRALLAWLRAESARNPLLVVLDDLHWADLSTISYLTQALNTLGDQPLFLLALARPDIHDAFPKLWQSQAVHELQLRGLTKRAAERLARALLPIGADDAIVRHAVERADGNPFFLEELLHAGGQASEAPETVLLMVQSRLGKLDAEARRVLRAASVFGETCWSRGVGALLESDTDAAAWCEALVEEDILVRRRDARFPGEQEYAFRHSLLREAAYAMLTPQDCCAAHRSAGEWLAATGERDARMLAYHFERGGATTQAVHWMVRASFAASDAGDFTGALALSHRAIELGASGPERGILLLIQGHASVANLRPDARLLQEALVLLPQASDNWWFTLSMLVFWYVSSGQRDLSKPCIDLALATIVGHEPTGVSGRAVQAIAAAADMSECIELGWTMLDKFSAHEVDGAALDPSFVAWMNLARAQLATRAPVRGVWQLEQALAWARESAAAMSVNGACSGEAYANFYMGRAYRLLGCYEEAEQALSASARLEPGRGPVLISQYAELFLAQLILQRRGAAEARLRLAPLLDNPDRNIADGAKLVVAEAHYREGDLQAALRATQDVMRGRSPSFRRLARTTHARALLGLGQLHEALETTNTPLALEAAPPTFTLDLLASRAQALHHLGRLEESKEVLGRALEFSSTLLSGIEHPYLRRTFSTQLDEYAKVQELAALWCA